MAIIVENAPVKWMVPLPKKELDNFYNTKWQILDLENITRNYDRDQNVEVEKKGVWWWIGKYRLQPCTKSGEKWFYWCTLSVQ